MLTVHKSSPPMQHGKAMSANEEAVAMYVHDAYADAAADLSLNGELYLHGGVDALVGHFIDQLKETRGWRAFVASLTMVAGYAARRALPGGRITKASVAVTGIFDLLDEKAIEYSGIHSAEFIKYITDQAKFNAQGFINASLNGVYTVNQLERQLRNIITLTPRQVSSIGRAVEAYGADLGKEGIYTQQEIRDRMDEFHQKLSLQKLKQRTRAISRTELSTANNAGHLIGVANGIEAGYIHPDTMKQWNTAEDEKTCPICRPQDGETVRWDQPFSSGLMSPPAHVTCRCNFVDLPPDYENDPGYKPIPSEQQVYGDTVDQEFPADDWKGPDLTQIEHLLGETSSAVPTLSEPSSGIVPDIEDAIDALDVVGLVRSVALAIGEQFEGLNLPQQEAIAAFVVRQGIGWKMSEWSPAQRADLKDKIGALADVKKSVIDIRKFNPNHDARGRFANGHGFAPTGVVSLAPGASNGPLTDEQLAGLQPTGKPYANREMPGFLTTPKATAKLMSTTPEGKALTGIIMSFQNGNTHRPISLLRSDVVKVHDGETLDPGRAKNVSTLLGAIRQSTTDKPLYRGMKIPGSQAQVQALYKPGQKLALSVSSFSASRSVATSFAHQPIGPGGRVKRAIPVMVEWEGGVKHALPIQNFAPQAALFKEREWVTAGDFTVTSVRPGRVDFKPGVIIGIKQDSTW